MYAYKYIKENQIVASEEMNDYTVNYKGKKLSLEDYLSTKEQESVLFVITSKNEEVEKVQEAELELADDYVVTYNGKLMSMDEYLTIKEQEAI